MHEGIVSISSNGEREVTAAGDLQDSVFFFFAFLFFLLLRREKIIFVFLSLIAVMKQFCIRVCLLSSTSCL